MIPIVLKVSMKEKVVRSLTAKLRPLRIFCSNRSYFLPENLNFTFSFFMKSFIAGLICMCIFKSENLSWRSSLDSTFEARRMQVKISRSESFRPRTC